MLSYQHGYHAGNLADVHKHAVLARVLEYLVQKDKPLSYIETHAGRGLYDLDSAEAHKTGEAAQGIERHDGWFDADHPLSRAREAVRKAHGPSTYPGSPAIAAHILRPTDSLHLAELHPGEHAELKANFRNRAKLHQQDGFALAHSLTPPTPRRGVMLIDPSYEVKADYGTIPGDIAGLHRAWNVGVILLWYPLLQTTPHAPMLKRLQNRHPDAVRHEVRFPPARPGHGMTGSGMFVLNPPFGLQAELDHLTQCFRKLS